MATKLEIQNTPQNIDIAGVSWTERSFSHPERTIRLATSFSGIGAIEYAFKRLGLKSKIVFAGDIDANCKKSYFANYEIKEEQWHTDIHLLNAKPYKGKVDLFVGGAPCQAFSIVGEQRGFDDTRGTLFREFARVVKECQPKVFIFENVQGLFKHDQGEHGKLYIIHSRIIAVTMFIFNCLMQEIMGYPKPAKDYIALALEKPRNSSIPLPFL